MSSSIYDNAAHPEVTAASKDIDMVENMCYRDPKDMLENADRGSTTSKYCRSSSKCAIAVTVTVVVLTLSIVAACTGFALEITKLQDEIASLTSQQQTLQQTINTVSDRLDNTTVFNPASSCAALPPSSLSGYYWVMASNGSAVRVYCDMTRSCGGVTGGWMRVAQLDMTNSSHQCPSPLRESNESNIRTCVRESTAGGCSSTIFKTSNINYRSVCGRIIAYQYGHPEAFHGGITSDIDSHYVDGVSLTHGTPRKHIWTFAAASDELASSTCLCIRSDLVNRTTAVIPLFVGDDYFCDTGSQNQYQLILYSGDPLWDGAGCGHQSSCCSFNTPPWFYRQLPQPTTDDIEMRVCRDSRSSNEDIAIAIIDIYVR